MKQATALLLLFFVVSVAPGCVRASYEKRGEAAMAGGRYQEAEIFFRKAIQLHPRSAKAHYELAQVLIREGNGDLAYTELQRAKLLDPKNQDVQLALAQFLLMSGKADKAEGLAKQIFNDNPHSLQAEMLLSDISAQQGKFADARKQYQRVIKDHPDRAAGYNGLARVAIALGLRDEALQNLDHAIAAEPKDMDAYVIEAKYLMALKKNAEAVAILRRALVADPHSGPAMLTLGDALMANRQQNDAYALWRKMASKGPVSELACARLVLAELDHGQERQAAEDLKLVSTAGPSEQNYPDLLLAHARVLLSQRKYQEAANLLVEFTQRSPGYAPAYYYLGTAYLALSKPRDAQKALETAEQLAPVIPQAEVLLSGLEYNQHDYARAIDHANRAITLDDKNTSAYMLLGDSLFAEKQLDQAVEQYRQALAIDPKLAAAYERLGRIARLQNHPDIAIAEFNQALKFQPTLMDASEELTQALWQSKGPAVALARLHAQVLKQGKNSSPYFQALYGSYLERNSQHIAAETELKSAIAAQPNMIGAYTLLAGVYQQTGQTDKMVSVLKQVLERNPKYIPALMGLAAEADKRGDHKSAIQYYQKIVAIDPNLASPDNNLAWDYSMENENLDQALNLAKHARQVAPKDPYVADTLAFIMIKRGVPAAALPLLKESVAARPNSSTVHYHLGLARLALNEPVKATTEFDTALKLKPDAAETSQINNSLSQANQLLSQQSKGEINPAF